MLNTQSINCFSKTLESLRSDFNLLRNVTIFRGWIRLIRKGLEESRRGLGMQVDFVGKCKWEEFWYFQMKYNHLFQLNGVICIWIDI